MSLPANGQLTRSGSAETVQPQLPFSRRNPPSERTAELEYSYGDNRHGQDLTQPEAEGRVGASDFPGDECTTCICQPLPVITTATCMRELP